MRAMVYDRFGADSVLRMADVDDPRVGPGEVRIRVKRAAVNPVDWKVMSGGLVGLMDAYFPVIPCWDVAGVVERVGFDTPEFAVGDEVVAYARKDVVGGGTAAELVTMSVRGVGRKSSALSWDQAAGLPLAGLTALRVLSALRVAAGDTLLIHGAAGGVGSMAVQIAKAWRARVIGTASPANHPFVTGLGADHAVAYGEGLAERVRVLAPQGVDAVADFVGGVLETTLSVLAPGGRHASIADAGVLAAGGRYVWVRPDAARLEDLAGMADDGILNVPVCRVYPLGELASAFAESRSGHVVGKLVLHVSD